ncbi:MAG TPA: ABC transporter ATP-binding protein [Sedimentisphaerales bacterium]|jgi:ABC-2 type transport system ATP-binding protein|nr:ABC transporter ATP-binding protein [Sedimentisphaerales bacterium]HNU31663.1 ABC transporter ATP-binding protein [Sedimentisphaerales bacterium]
MIQVEDLQKSYGSLRAVDRISLEVPEGELFGFLGPNGAGKTTTLSMISGLLKPDHGRVSIAQIDVWSSPKAAKRLLGLVPQDLALYEELSARENLMFWGSLFDLPRSRLKANIDLWLDRVGLKDRAKEPVSKFSGGMKRRLNLAIGLVHNPKVVLLDEPTVGIDPQARNNILDVIRQIAAEGATILFTTHHLEEAEALCDRIAIMDHGRILETGSVEELAKVAGDGDVVTVSGPFAPARFRAVLEGQSVNVLSAAENTGAVSLSPGQMNIVALLQKLSEGGIEVTDVSVQKPSLESVFLKLTGRELRD